MNQETLKELLENTFSKLACPANGHGMYSELERALIEAYNLGKAQQEAHHLIKPREELMYGYFRA